jgi:N-acetylmuramoyl-L-alanine amidase
MNIALDLGHGVSADRGAEGYIAEEAIINAVGAELMPILRAGGHQVLSVRPLKASSENDSLQKRVQASNDFGADLYLSIHANDSSWEGGAETTLNPVGSETFAISAQGRRYAKKIVDALATLGWKNRGVRHGSHLHVVSNTDAPAVLIEVCFGDSKADTDLYKSVGAKKVAQAIASSIGLTTTTPPTTPGTVLNPPVTSKTLGQLINEGGCSTAPLDKLNQALIKEAILYDKGLTLIDDPNIKAADKACNLFFVGSVGNSLKAIAAKFKTREGRPLTINSAYRTAAQQIVLSEWAARKMCDIAIAARPGTSNHEGARAIDTPDYADATDLFKGAGWVWQMDKSGNDPVHFEMGSGSKNTVLILQRYWNKYNTNKLAEDGQYGPATRAAALKIPISGY